MPITKKRPDISELVQAALKQHKITSRNTLDSLERPVTVWYHDDDSCLFKKFLSISRFCKLLLLNSSMSYVRFVVAGSATVVIGMESNFYPQKLSSNLREFEIVTNCLVMLEALVRIIALPVHVRLELAFERDVNLYDVVSQSGLLELAVSIICFALIDTGEVAWFQLLRAIIVASVFIEFFPFMGVLITGIKNSIRSLSFTILLLFLVIMAYASLCHILFAENDPFRFGTLGLSALTLFTLTTFNAWSVAYYINYGGCDSFPSEYSQQYYLNGTGSRVETKFGVFYQPVCNNPSSNEIVASFIFISFSFVCGYFIMNMSLAAVAIGFKEKLNELVAAVDEAESVKYSTLNEKASKLIGANRKISHLKKMLNVIWGETKAYATESENSFVLPNIKSFKNFQDFISSLVSSRNYDYVLSAFCLAVAVLEIYESTVEYRGAVGFGFHVLFQVVFTIDIFLKSIDVLKHNFSEFFRRIWVLFDVVVTVFSWLPVFAPQNESFHFLVFLRILRLMRTLRNFSFIKDLGVIINSIAGSFDSVMYLLWLLLLLIFYSACLATLMFKESDPYRFGDLVSSIRTLVQIMTTDDCWNTMRVSMLGCKYFGYNVGVPKYDSMCTFSDQSDSARQGLGWWAPMFFVSFMILTTLVLINLLLGVIITSMGLLRDGVVDEIYIWNKVNEIKDRYLLSNKVVDLLLELFEMMDEENGCNGSLSFNEIKPIMDVVAMPDSNKFEFFMKVDTNGSGQIDFAEFCEFITLIGISHHSNDRHKSTSRHKHKTERVVIKTSNVVTIEDKDKSRVIVKDHHLLDREARAAEELSFISSHVTRVIKDTPDDDSNVLATTMTSTELHPSTISGIHSSIDSSSEQRITADIGKEELRLTDTSPISSTQNNIIHVRTDQGAETYPLSSNYITTDSDIAYDDDADDEEELKFDSRQVIKSRIQLL